MKRRDFLRAASVPAATATASAAAGVGAAQEGTSTSGGSGTAGTGAGTGTGSGGTGTGAGSGGGGGGGGASKTVEVGPGGSLVFTPGTDEALQIAPGTTVEFVWMSDNHNIVPDSTPEGSSWSGHEPIENEGFTYTHTFSTLGTYEYHCQPHESAGMVGTVEVVENPSSGGGGEKELEELGVPIQAHWVGAATILGIIVTAIFTFYILKYGESAHTGTGRNG